jgi:hypothetical protein
MRAAPLAPITGVLGDLTDACDFEAGVASEVAAEIAANVAAEVEYREDRNSSDFDNGLFIPLPGILSALVFFVRRRASSVLKAPKLLTSSRRLSRSAANDGMTDSIR